MRDDDQSEGIVLDAKTPIFIEYCRDDGEFVKLNMGRVFWECRHNRGFNSIKRAKSLKFTAKHQLTMTSQWCVGMICLYRASSRWPYICTPISTTQSLCTLPIIHCLRTDLVANFSWGYIFYKWTWQSRLHILSDPKRKVIVIGVKMYWGGTAASHQIHNHPALLLYCVNPL